MQFNIAVLDIAVELVDPSSHDHAEAVGLYSVGIELDCSSVFEPDENPGQLQPGLFDFQTLFKRVEPNDVPHG